MSALPVYETFTSFQGEGVHLGRKAHFIRLFGCPVHCPWCDSAGTWHPDHVPASIDRIAPAQLAEAAAASRPAFVVITGGEPAIHDLTALTTALRERSLRAHLETSGAFRIRGAFDWVTVSPKRWKPPVAEAVTRADEFKLIIDEPGEVNRWRAALGLDVADVPVWLHPEWSRRDEPTIRAAILDAVSRLGDPYRAGWQVHNEFGVR